MMRLLRAWRHISGKRCNPSSQSDKRRHPYGRAGRPTGAYRRRSRKCWSRRARLSLGVRWARRFAERRLDRAVGSFDALGDAAARRRPAGTKMGPSYGLRLARTRYGGVHSIDQWGRVAARDGLTTRHARPRRRTSPGLTGRCSASCSPPRALTSMMKRSSVVARKPSPSWWKASPKREAPTLGHTLTAQSTWPPPGRSHKWRPTSCRQGGSPS